MSYHVYHFLHFASLALLAGTVGGMAFAKRSSAGKPAKSLTICHGIASLVMLVAGFGLMARRGDVIQWDTWLFVKIGVWVLLSGLPFGMRKSAALRGVSGLLILTAALVAVAWALQQRGWANYPA